MSFASWKASQSSGASPKPVLSPSSGSAGGFAAFRARMHPEEVAPSTETPEAVQESTSPFKLSGATTLSQTPEKAPPFGFVGQAAKAAYDTAKDTITGAATKLNDFFGTLTAHSKREDLKAITDNQGNVDYTKDTGLTIGMTPEQRKSFYEDLAVQEKPITKIAKGGSAILGTANIAFTPVTAQLEAAKKVPLLKYPAEGVSWIFGKLGQAGSYVFNKGLDVAPISDQEKTTLRPLADELGGFIGQLAGIKAGFKLAETGGSKIIDRLPVSDKAKTGIETGVKHLAGLSMTPFSHIYGVASGMLADKIEQRKKDGVEITPEEGKKIVDEIKAEMPNVIKNTNLEEAAPAPAETKPLSFSEWKDAGKPEQSQKEDLRTVMEGLSTGGYSSGDVVEIMKNLFDKHPLGDFTRADVAAEADNFKPERPNNKTKKGNIVSMVKVKPEVSRETSVDITKYDTPNTLEQRKRIETLPQSSSIDTPERQKLRKDLVEETYGEGAKNKNKRIDIVTGGPGTRKSSMVAEPLAAEHGSIIIDPDHIKPKLRGNDVGSVHEESAAIAKDVRNKAFENGDNIVLATIGDQEANLNRIIDIAHSHGYEVHVTNVKLPLEKSIEGLHQRNETKEQDFVDPKYAQKVGLTPEKIHDIIKSNGKITSHRQVSTDVSRGERPLILDSSGDKRSTGKSGRVDESREKLLPSDNAGKDHNERVSSTFQSRVFERLQAERPDILQGDLTVEHKKLKEDLDRATELLTTDKQKLFDIAMNKENSSDISSTSANIVLAEKALEEGNYELYSKLVRNRSLDLTRKGFDIAAERGSISDNSTSKYVKELIASRLDILGKKYLSDLGNKIRNTTDKAKATKIIDKEVSKLEIKIRQKKIDTKTALSLLDQLTCV